MGNNKNNDSSAPTQADFEAQIAALIAENASLRSAKPSGVQTLSYKASAKGCLSLYGVRQMGIHLYAGEWIPIFENAAVHMQAMATQWSGLTFKDGTEEATRVRLVALAKTLGVELEFDSRDVTVTRAAIELEAANKAAARAAKAAAEG